MNEPRGDVIGTPEQRSSNWYSRVLQALSVEDAAKFRDLRNYIGTNGTFQRWFYGAAGFDLAPIFMAPESSIHTYVELGYGTNIGYALNTPQVLSDKFQKPFENLGATVDLDRSWQESIAVHKQTLRIDKATTIYLVSGDMYHEANRPQDIHGIYTTGVVTPAPDRFALKALRRGGLYVVGSHVNDKRILHGVLSEGPISLPTVRFADMGFHVVRVYPFTKLDMPNNTNRASTYPYEVRFIYRKIRDMTPDESDLIDLHDIMSRIGVINDYLTCRPGSVGQGAGNIVIPTLIRQLFDLQREIQASTGRAHLLKVFQYVENNLLGEARRDTYIQEQKNMGEADTSYIMENWQYIRGLYDEAKKEQV